MIASDGTVEETNHYYPFGGLFASTASAQPYKYNGKEFDSKNGLNWYDYGARMYDPVLGRFTTVDPMAEKYYGISPYTYCGNNPILFIDEFGLEFGPGDLFKTKRDAAKDWGLYYNGASIIRRREMGSSIYEVKTEGELKGYTYSEAAIGAEHSAKVSSSPHGEQIVGTIHSHGGYDKNYKDNYFSTTDIENNKSLDIIGYLATPNGSLLEHNPSTGKIEIISEDLPSDAKDPTRKNEIKPIDNLVQEQASLFTKIKDWIKQLFE